MTGQSWQWTRLPTTPIRASGRWPARVGEYNGKFMVGQMVLRGGSVATPPGHSRPSYRNFFPPAARWQFSGLRLAKDAAHADALTCSAREAVRRAARMRTLTSARSPDWRGLAIAAAQHLAQVFLRRRGSRAVRPHLRAARVLPDPHRAAASCERTRAEIAAQIGPQAEIVEFGAGSLRKVRLLLDALRRSRARYVPIDISGEHLRDAAAALRRGLSRAGGAAGGGRLHPAACIAAGRGRAAASASVSSRARPSAISRRTRRCISCSARAGMLGAAARLLLGADLVKDPRRAACGLQRRAGRDRGIQPQPAGARQPRARARDFDLDGSPTAPSTTRRCSASRCTWSAAGAQTVAAGRRALRDSTRARRCTPRTRTSSPSTACARWRRRAGFRPGPVWTDPQRLFSVHWLHAPGLDRAARRTHESDLERRR